MLDLSSLMPSEERGRAEFHDMELHQLAGMNEYQRDAHISSMKHSMKTDFQGRKLRIVVVADEYRTQGLHEAALDTAEGVMLAQKLPGMTRSIMEAAEVVVRGEGWSREFVLKQADGTTGWRPLAGDDKPDQVSETVPVAEPTDDPSRPRKRRMIV